MEAEPRGPRPAVYARLGEEAEVRLLRRTPHPAWRSMGWVLSLAIAVLVVVVVLSASPW